MDQERQQDASYAAPAHVFFDVDREVPDPSVALSGTEWRDGCPPHHASGELGDDDRILCAVLD